MKRSENQAFNNIPDELKKGKRWVVWKVEKRDGKDTKVPYTPGVLNPHTLNRADSTDSETWRSFNDAKACYDGNDTVAGLGFVLGDGYCGIDIDGRELDDPFIIETVGRFNSYTDISPSGNGVHIIIKGKKPGDRCKEPTKHVEIYDADRYFTMTGNLYDESHNSVESRQDALTAFYYEIFPPEQKTERSERPSREVTKDDHDLLEKARQASNGAKFIKLFDNGDGSDYDSKSEADLALCSMLAFWTQGDIGRIDSLFRQSAFYREKWDREDYRDKTIAKALEKSAMYDPNYRSTEKKESSKQTSHNSSNQESQESSSQESNDYESNGLHESDFCYYRFVKDDDDFKEKVVSSFIIQPKMRVWLDGKEDVIADIKSPRKVYEDIIIRRSAWSDAKTFKNALPSIDLQWTGSATDVQGVMGIVSQYDIPIRTGTPKLGLHEYQNQPVWIMPNGAYTENGFTENVDLVYLPFGGHGELDDKIGYPDVNLAEVKRMIYEHLLHLHRPEVILPLLSWFFATPFKPHFDKYLGGFPLLSVAGTRGAGKSTLLRTLWRIFGQQGGMESKLFSCTETDFVLLKLLSATTSIPIVLDEYKPYDMPPHRVKALTRILRRSYNGESEFKGRPDQTTIEYQLSSPVAIAGEVALTEGAMLERIIPVFLSPNDLSNTHKAALAILQRQSLASFCRAYVPYTLSLDFHYVLNHATQFVSSIVRDEIPPRILNNLVSLTFGFFVFLKYGGLTDESDGRFEIPDDLRAQFKFVLGDCIKYLCGGNSATPKVAFDFMLEHWATMAETKRLRLNQDYCVDEYDGLIYLRFDSCFAEFRKYARETQLVGEILDADAYKRQIKENYDLNLYIEDHQKVKKFGQSAKRSILIDKESAEGILGVDLDGFFGNDPPKTDETTE